MTALDRVQIWSVDLAGTGRLLAIDRERGLLPPDEKNRLDRTTDPSGRKERMAAHIALRLALLDHVPFKQASAPFARANGGRPSLRDDGVAFSLAHTDGLALIAIGPRAPLGIDVEPVRSVAVGAERRTLYSRAAELFADGAALTGATEDARFIQAWTRVEAIAKATGLGIAGLIAALDLRTRAGVPTEAAVDATLRTGPDRLVAHDLAVSGNARAAVAAPRRLVIGPLEIFSVD